jgi:hypothetical protein
MTEQPSTQIDPDTIPTGAVKQPATRAGAYEATRAKLEAKFPEEAHSTRDGYTYVDPMHYRTRLNDVFTEGYTFEVKITSMRPEGFYGDAYFIATLNCVIYVRRVLWSEPWMFAKDSKDLIKIDTKIQSANSAGLKAVCRELGIGLYLYDKQSPQSSVAQSGQQRSQTQQQPQQSRPSGPVGTGEDDVWQIGTKWKGHKVSEIGDDYFAFIGAPDKTGSASDAARAILKRRSEGYAQQTFDSVGSDTQESFFPDEVPF